MSFAQSLHIRDLSCRRGERLLFSAINCILTPGDALVITGPNGAGKSSLLRIIAGLLEPADGTVSLGGETDASERSAASHSLAHKDGLKPALTARESLAWTQALLGTAGLTVDQALEQTGIVHIAALPTAYLSAGQKRRIGLARLLCSPRPLWLLDEPTAALDADGQALLDRLVAGHRAAGGIVIAATHQPLPWPGAQALRLGDGAGAEWRL